MSDSNQEALALVKQAFNGSSSESTVESNVESTPAEPIVQPVKEPEDKFAKRFSMLSKREKEIQEKQKAMEAKEAQYKDVEAILTSKNPAKVLEKLGMGVEDFLSLLAGIEPEVVHVDPVTKKLNEVEDRLNQISEKEKQEKERLEAQRIEQTNKVLNEYMMELGKFVEANIEQDEA